MNRTLLAINVALAAALVALWAVDSTLEWQSEARRAHDSVHVPVAVGAVGAEATVERLELHLPGAGQWWTYDKKDGAWRIPGYRGAYAMTQDVEGIVKSFLESWGTVVGQAPADAEHFGLVDGRKLEVKISGAGGRLILAAEGGFVAPGQRSGECFLRAAGQEPILHAGANPWSYLARASGSRFPPLMDPKVIPGALGRGLPAKVTFGGGAPPAVSELIRREAPKDPRFPMGGPDRGPRYEWYGKTAEGEKRINDQVAFGYTSFLAGLACQDLVGPIAGHEQAVASPSLTVTIEYDGGTKDVLTLGGAGEKGLRHVLHGTTGQLFVISAEDAAKMTPDSKALLELPPPPKEAPPQLPQFPLQPGEGVPVPLPGK